MSEFYQGRVTVADLRAVIRHVKRLTETSLSVFGRFFDDTTCWPYELNDSKPVQARRAISTSTTAMILHACAVATGRVRDSVLVPAIARSRPAVPSGSLTAVMETAYEQLFASCDVSDNYVTTSTTWGDDDPLTLAWLYELLADRDDWAALRNRVVQAAVERITDAFENPDNAVLRGGGITRSTMALPHSFPILRLVQLERALLRDGQLPSGSTKRDRVAGWLSTRLHLQLSFSEIANSDFDPAELLFALEGILLLQGDRVADAMIQRVMEVMQRSAQSGTYWRPVTPLRIDSQGSILLPQSVEVANSLLRICCFLELDGSAVRWFAPVVADLLRYTEWLGGRLVHGAIEDGRRFEGWQSDHTHSEGRIHLWATSQALLFCRHFGALAQQFLAKLLRDEAGVSSRRLPVCTVTSADAWKKLSDKDPLSGLPATSGSRVYNRVWTRFIAPRVAGNDGAKSMLLYGPPGTGKTSFAEDLAQVLGWELIIVTPSDFIRAGEAGVEARARHLFEMLSEQIDVVVLFDEIDRLILSRDSEIYGSQSDMFQFMTPSMLTKLNDLRRSGSVVSVIATNYEDRIDSAIKRSGRVDESLLLLPPDATQRRKIVIGLMKKSAPAGNVLEEADLDRVVAATPLFSFQEIRYVFEGTFPSVGPDVAPVDILLEGAAQFKPAVSLASYWGRFFRKGATERLETVSAGPYRELAYLAYICFEVDLDPLSEHDWIEPILRHAVDGGFIVDLEVRSCISARLSQGSEC